MRIVEVSSKVPDRLVDMMKKAYHLVPIDKRILVCPNSMWEKFNNTVKTLAQDVTAKYERVFQERSMILVKDTVKDAQAVGENEVRVKFNKNKEVVGRLVMSGGSCPFCGASKLTFLSLQENNERITVCLSCKKNVVIINSDSIKYFDRLFPEIYKIV
jgi:hypothetical protein